jgi:hypothetical protein
MVADPKKRLVYKTNAYFRIKDIDVFNLKALYTVLHEFFVEEEFCEDDQYFPELYLRERNGQKRGREVLVYWRFNKTPFGVTFYNRTIDVMIKVIAVKNVEVLQEGKKFELQKGVFEIKVWGYLEYDALGNWRNHWFLKHFLEIYVKRIAKDDMEVHRNEMLREVELFQRTVKDYLNMLKWDEKEGRAGVVAGVEKPW